MELNNNLGAMKRLKTYKLCFHYVRVWQQERYLTSVLVSAPVASLPTTPCAAAVCTVAPMMITGDLAPMMTTVSMMMITVALMTITLLTITLR